jgi:hypothetical protein
LAHYITAPSIGESLNKKSRSGDTTERESVLDKSLETSRPPDIDNGTNTACLQSS